MATFRDFELQAIHLMANNAFSEAQLALLRGFEAASDYRYTGSGYYLSVKHPALPQKKQTL
jgi:hypothetical protein